MCGIVGFLSNRRFESFRDDLPYAVSTLAHRGPDDSGLFFDQNSGVGLGHRRLSVIDLSEAGHQPMPSDDGLVHIVYNGEIYNFKELRKILRGDGFKFRGDSDTEVLLKAYLRWGTGALEKLVGMFALAIWDGRNDQLFLARDRLGIKPLYYHFREGEIIFGSELKSLMAFKTFQRNVDTNSIPLFLHYQYVPAPRTIFRNTSKLLPGHCLIFDGNKISMKCFWSLPDMAKHQDSIKEYEEEEQLEKLEHLLIRSISDRLISDVPLGALLSGGIDSSIVVALMQKVSNATARTFNIGFKESGYDEAPWANRVARHLKTDHTLLYVTPKEAVEVIPILPEIYDEPFADSSAIPTHLVSRLTRSEVTVALSGDGGDEQFAGYVRYFGTKLMATRLQNIPDTIRKKISRILKFIPTPWANRAYMNFKGNLPQRFQMENFPDKWQKLIESIRHSDISDLYRMTICLWAGEELRELMSRDLAESQFEETFTETKDWPEISRLMRVDQRTYLPDAMLTKVDRASMRVGLEVRVPLLDHRIVEFSSNLNEDLKYRGGTGKYLLRKLLSKYVPKELFERPKMGFGVPIDTWLRRELKEMLLDYLSSDRLKKEGLFDHLLVEKKIREHISGKTNHHYRLWALLMWEMWRDRWLEN